MTAPAIVALAFEGGNLLPQQHFIADPAGSDTVC